MSLGQEHELVVFNNAGEVTCERGEFREDVFSEEVNDKGCRVGEVFTSGDGVCKGRRSVKRFGKWKSGDACLEKEFGKDFGGGWSSSRLVIVKNGESGVLGSNGNCSDFLRKTSALCNERDGMDIGRQGCDEWKRSNG